MNNSNVATKPKPAANANQEWFELFFGVLKDVHFGLCRRHFPELPYAVFEVSIWPRLLDLALQDITRRSIKKLRLQVETVNICRRTGVNNERS